MPTVKLDFEEKLSKDDIKELESKFREVEGVEKVIPPPEDRSLTATVSIVSFVLKMGELSFKGYKKIKELLTGKKAKVVIECGGRKLIIVGQTTEEEIKQFFSSFCKS